MERVDGITVLSCERCPALTESRSQIVNGTGPEDADLLFVGEAPGEQEDQDGAPFVGRSGTVLTEVFRDHGFTRDDVRITNCIRCRPPDNRDPTREELANCRSYLDTEITLVDPDVIVTLGKVPSEHLLNRPVAVTTEAGTVETIEIRDVPRRVLICVHPAATLYDPDQRDTIDTAISTAVSLVETPQSTFHDYQ